MLNRTNRTLSANLNRLNLGTRSLAILADVNNGDLTLRIRHVHRDVMHDGMTAFPPSLIPISEDVAVPVLPSSPPVSPWLVASRVVPSWVGFAVETCAEPSRECRRGATSQEPSPERQQPRQKRSQGNRKPVTGKRLYLGNGSGSGYASARAALATDAALFAASGG